MQLCRGRGIVTCTLYDIRILYLDDAVPVHCIEMSIFIDNADNCIRTIKKIFDEEYAYLNVLEHKESSLIFLVLLYRVFPPIFIPK